MIKNHQSLQSHQTYLMLMMLIKLIIITNHHLLSNL